MKKNHYLLIKRKFGNEIVYIDYNKLDGFKIKPRNRVRYDGIEVNKLLIIKPTFIEKIIKRKIKIKLDNYLQYIIMLIENNDDTDASSLSIVLDDVTRYSQMIKNKYRKYLDDKYYELLLKKVSLLEQELKKKIFKIKITQSCQEEVVEKKTR